MAQDSLSGSLVFLFMEVDDVYQMVGGQLSLSDAVSNTLIDITNKSSQDYRELLSGEGLSTRDITLELQFNSDEIYQSIRRMGQSKAKANFRIVRGITGLNDDFEAIVASVGDSAPMSEKVTTSITLQATTFTLDDTPGPTVPLITLQPRPTSVRLGGDFRIMSRAIGWDSVAWYRVLFDDEGNETGTEQIIGADERDYTGTANSVSQDTLYFVRYTNTIGSVDSRRVRLKVLFDRSVQSQIYPLSFSDSLSKSLLLSDVENNAVRINRGQLENLSKSTSINSIIIERQGTTYNESITEELSKSLSIQSIEVNDVRLDVGQTENLSKSIIPSTITITRVTVNIPNTDNLSKSINIGSITLEQV